MPVIQKMSSTEQARFSPSGDRLAVTTADGRLTLWKPGTTQCEQQFVPSNHLEAHSTCLAWAPTTTNRRKKKKKKEKLDTSHSFDNSSDLLAIGSSAGTVLVYSVRQGDLVTTMKKENSNKINSVIWANSASTIFAAGEDGVVSLFSVSKLALMSSFQAGVDPIFSLAVNNEDSLLVTGSRAVNVWEMASQKIVRTFTGHANPVIGMRVEGGLLVTAAEEERTLSVWSLDKEINTSVANLSVNEAVAEFDTLRSTSDELSVSVVSREGKLHLFRLPTNMEKKKKPLKPSNTVVVTTGKEESGRVEPLPVLGARLELREELEINIAHGTVLRPVMERLTVSELSQSHTLVRKSPVVKVNTDQGDFTKTVTPNTQGDVVFLAPGETQPVGTGKLGKRKQDTKPKEVDSLPMEDRLALLSTASEGTVNAPPRADSLAQLLAQGLHSSDSRILSSVLDRTDSQLIDNTVRKIPVEAVVPLVTTLMRYIKGRGMVYSSHAKWMRSVLTLHTGYLVSVPDCQDLLTPVYALLETRTSHYSQVLQLRGKLELLTKKTEEKVETAVDTNKDALLVYQDESSDELEDVIDDLLVPGSETDDNWEDEDNDEEDMEADDNSDSDCVEIVNGDDDVEEMESDDD